MTNTKNTKNTSTARPAYDPSLPCCPHGKFGCKICSSSSK